MLMITSKACNCEQTTRCPYGVSLCRTCELGQERRDHCSPLNRSAEVEALRATSETGSDKKRESKFSTSSLSVCCCEEKL